MNLLLMIAGYPMAIIRKEDRQAYIKSIEKAQLGGSDSDYRTLIYQAISAALDIYLEAVEGKGERDELQQKALLRIGELAKLTGESVATIRHWTKAGLLAVQAYSKGGYQLYGPEQAKACKKIRKLQREKRWSVEEIGRFVNCT